MQLSARTVVDQIEILSSGLIQVRTAEQIIQTNDDGSSSIIAVNFSRDTAEPGDNAKAQLLLADKAAIVNTIWTPDIIKNYQAAKAAQQNDIQAGTNAQLSPAG